jgi:serine/threonine-protein kinase
MVGMVMGTPSYMSPEQCQGNAVDRRSDIFSAGVVLYELLTNEKPFTGTIDSIGYKIVHDDPAPPSRVSSRELAPELDAIVGRALAKRPDDRYATAREFADALSAALGLSPRPPAEPSFTGDGGMFGDATAGTSTAMLASVPVDDEILRTITTELARFIGPVAHVMVKRASAQSSDLTQMCALLADHIVDPERRRQFTEAASRVDKSGQTATRRALTGQTQSTAGGGVVVQPLEPAFVAEATARLTHFLGPISKVVAKKAAARATSRAEFLARLGECLSDKDRVTFLRELGALESQREARRAASTQKVMPSTGAWVLVWTWRCSVRTTTPASHVAEIDSSVFSICTDSRG